MLNIVKIAAFKNIGYQHSRVVYDFLFQISCVHFSLVVSVATLKTVA